MIVKYILMPNFLFDCTFRPFRSYTKMYCFLMGDRTKTQELGKLYIWKYTYSMSQLIGIDTIKDKMQQIKQFFQKVTTFSKICSIQMP